MKSTTILAAAALLVARPAGAELDARLAGLEPFVGKTYAGSLVQPGSEEPIYDVQVWEEILGGKAVRITHSLNEGAYGGETVIFYDTKLEKVVFYYFTTADFYTHGTITFIDGGYVSDEVVEGGDGGIDAVRATARVLDGGRVRVNTEVRRDGAWVAGDDVEYEEAKGAEAVFR